MKSSKGRDLHAKAIHAREQEQDFLKSLKLLDEALVEYTKQKDVLGIASVQGSRFNAYKHLYQQTENKNYLVLAKHAALAAVDLADTNNIKERALIYRDLGKAYKELGDFKMATKYFKKALASKFPKDNDSVGVKAEVKAHLAYAMYKSGDKEGLELINEAINDLEKFNGQKFEKDVWLSGAHMRAADMLKDDNRELAKKHFLKAQEIINANKELVLRKKQWEKLNNQQK